MKYALADARRCMSLVLRSYRKLHAYKAPWFHRLVEGDSSLSNGLSSCNDGNGTLVGVCVPECVQRYQKHYPKHLPKHYSKLHRSQAWLTSSSGSQSSCSCSFCLSTPQPHDDRETKRRSWTQRPAIAPDWPQHP